MNVVGRHANRMPSIQEGGEEGFPEADNVREDEKMEIS